MRVTVCVATKNRTEMLHQLLWSLIRQTYADWDLVIVDDSDTPVQWERLGVYPRLFAEMKRTGHGISIASGPRASRIGAAYQAGFRVRPTENPLFLRVDDDSWLEPDYLDKLTAVMRGPDVAACGGLFLHPGGEIEEWDSNDSRYRHASIAGLSDSINVQWVRHSRRDLIPVEHLTANILFSTKRLESIGGFETNLYRLHRDETQATWRLHLEGGSLFVHPTAVAWHLRGVTGGARGCRHEVYIDDHRRFMAQRRSMRPGIHVSLGHAIGDGFMSTPMLHLLRQANPSRNIAVYAPWASAVLSANPDVDEIAGDPLDAQRTVRLEYSVYAWASANHWKGHLAEAYCKMLDLPHPKDIRPRLHWSDSDEANRIPDSLRGTEYVVVAPWSGARTFDFFGPSGNKNWLPSRWDSVIEWCHRAGFGVVQLRGSSDEPLLRGVDHDLCAAPLRQAFACIGNARLLVSVDTMAHHAAAALGTPSVVLWGRSKPDHFGYREEGIINLQGICPGISASYHSDAGRDVDDTRPGVRIDRPCINGDQWAMDQTSCPIEGHPCMAGITEDRVLDAISRLAGGSGKFRRRDRAGCRAPSGIAACRGE